MDHVFAKMNGYNVSYRIDQYEIDNCTKFVPYVINASGFFTEEELQRKPTADEMRELPVIEKQIENILCNTSKSEIDRFTGPGLKLSWNGAVKSCDAHRSKEGAWLFVKSVSHNGLILNYKRVESSQLFTYEKCKWAMIYDSHIACDNQFLFSVTDDHEIPGTEEETRKKPKMSIYNEQF